MILRQDESGEYRFGGSGSDHFSKMNFEAQTITGLDEYSRSIALLLGRVGRALYTELTSADSHQSFYGGGYELIEVTPSGIRKVPLTFVFWLCDHEPLPRPSGVVFSYVYDSNDVLGFRQFLINRDSKAWEQKIFPVHSFLNSAARPTFDLDRGIKTPWSIHYFVKPNAEHGSPMPVKVKNGDDPNISVEWDGTEVVAKVEDSFAPELKEIRATLNLSPWPSPFD